MTLVQDRLALADRVRNKLLQLDTPENIKVSNTLAEQLETLLETYISCLPRYLALVEAQTLRLLKGEHLNAEANDEMRYLEQSPEVKKYLLWLAEDVGLKMSKRKTNTI